MKPNDLFGKIGIHKLSLNIARFISVILTFLFTQNVGAQGGTHPGFDPDFGLFASLDNRVLLGILIIGSVLVYLFIKRKRKEH